MVKHRGILWIAALLSAVSLLAGEDRVAASRFGFDATDATECIQKALDSGARQVVVDRQPSDWVVRPLFLRCSNQEVILEDGVVIRALAGGFLGLGDCLLTAQDVTNVTVRGEGEVRLVMNRDDYLNKSRYAHSEWRHGITLRRVVDVTVDNLEVCESGGDGIYIDKCRRGRVTRVRSRRHIRQGMSVIAADGLTISDCLFADTHGFPPEAGIDFEPNEPSETIRGVTVERCRFENNEEAGLDINLARLSSETPPVSIIVRDCEMCSNGTWGISMGNCYGTPVKGRIYFENCKVSGSEKGGLRLVNQVADCIRVGFRECSFDVRGVGSAAFLMGNSGMFRTWGSVAFKDVNVLLDDGQECVSFDNLEANGVSDVHGAIEFCRGNRRERMGMSEFAAAHPPSVALGDFGGGYIGTTNLRPESGTSGCVEGCVWFRDAFSFAQFLPTAGEWPLEIRLQAVGDAQLQALVKVIDPDGNEISEFRARGETSPCVVKAEKSGVYRISVNSFGHAAAVVSPFSGQGVIMKDAVGLIGGRRDAAPYSFRFFVPASSLRVAAQVIPGGVGEPACARLMTPDGAVVASCEKATRGVILAAANVPRDGIWTLELPFVAEDCRVRLGSGAVPIAAFGGQKTLVCSAPQDGLYPYGTNVNTTTFCATGRAVRVR